MSNKENDLVCLFSLLKASLRTGFIFVAPFFLEKKEDKLFLYDKHHCLDIN